MTVKTAKIYSKLTLNRCFFKPTPDHLIPTKFWIKNQSWMELFIQAVKKISAVNSCQSAINYRFFFHQLSTPINPLSNLAIKTAKLHSKFTLNKCFIKPTFGHSSPMKFWIWMELFIENVKRSYQLLIAVNQWVICVQYIFNLKYFIQLSLGEKGKF